MYVGQGEGSRAAWEPVCVCMYVCMYHLSVCMSGRRIEGCMRSYVCMYVCMHACMCVGQGEQSRVAWEAVYVYMYVYVHRDIYVHLRIYGGVYVHVHVYVYALASEMCAYAVVCVCVCVCPCVHVCVCVLYVLCVCVCVRVRVRVLYLCASACACACPRFRVKLDCVYYTYIHTWMCNIIYLHICMHISAQFFRTRVWISPDITIIIGCSTQSNDHHRLQARALIPEFNLLSFTWLCMHLT